MQEYIAHETLAVDVNSTLRSGEISLKENINGELCDISIEKAR